MGLNKIAMQILSISEQMRKAFYNDVDYDEGDLYSFDQTWGSTALGFGGMGGSAMTTERTYVFVPAKLDKAYVFFGSRFAYVADTNENFKEDLRKHNMVSVQRSGRYVGKN